MNVKRILALPVFFGLLFAGYGAMGGGAQTSSAPNLKQLTLTEEKVADTNSPRLLAGEGGRRGWGGHRGGGWRGRRGWGGEEGGRWGWRTSASTSSENMPLPKTQVL